jgi:hypothetical protein
MVLVLACTPPRGATADCPPPDGTSSFSERAPELPTTRDAAGGRDGTVVVYLREAGTSGAPLAGANVVLHRGDAVGAGVGIIELTETDDIGLAMIDSVRPRDYRIDIRRIGYFPVSGRVEVRPGHVHIIDAALAKGVCGMPSGTDMGRVARYLTGSPG